jgi:predicted protein tyrosine phosphatase
MVLARVFSAKQDDELTGAAIQTAFRGLCNNPRGMDKRALQSALKSLGVGAVSDKLLRELFVILDRNGDDFISFDDFMLYIALFGTSDSKFPPVSFIANGLFLGSREDAKNDRLMRQLGVTHVLNATEELANYKEHGGEFKYLKLGLADEEEAAEAMHESLDKAKAFLDEGCSSNNACLVHCRYGQSRSATIIIAYIMASKRQTLRQAITQVKRRRPVIRPNNGFLGVLSYLDRRMHGTCALCVLVARRNCSHRRARRLQRTRWRV